MKNWALYAVIAVGLIGYRMATDANRDTSGAIVAAGNLNAFDVRVGDCFNDKSSPINGGGSIDELPGVPCSEPHDNEIFAVFDVEGDSFPDVGKMSQLAFDSCVARFETFVGLDYASSSLDVMTLYPTAESWAHQNDREVVCAVYDVEAKKLVGSAKGLAI